MGFKVLRQSLSEDNERAISYYPITPDLVLINKKRTYGGFCHSNQPLSQNKRKQKLKKLGGVIPIVIGALGMVLKELKKKDWEDWK